MYITISQKPIKELIDATQKQLYIMTSDYFSIKGNISQDNLFENLAEWVEWYNYFKNIPIYVTVMNDNYYKKNIGINTVQFTKWNIPTNIDKTNEENISKMLPESFRLWTDSDYFVNKYKKYIETNDFSQNPMVTMYLDGTK